MFKSGEMSSLEIVTERAIRELNNHPVGSEEYVRTLDQVVKLHKMREEEKSASVSKDTLIVAGTNLLGIIMIIKHEFLNVITSRALSLILKPRI